jgi:uncharacterized protein YdhG (YjbR/CyaY superfamily)
MPTTANNVNEYFENVSPAFSSAMLQLRSSILDNLPNGFQEIINYNMPSYVVPHEIYPSGYHCDTKLPLPFISIAAQKNFIALYHMGIYADPALLDWFTAEFSKHSKSKLDMGKSCIRFKKPDQIPFELIAQLVQKITVQDWIHLYEQKLKP